MGGYGVFDDWLGGRIELFALALKVKREREGGMALSMAATDLAVH